MRLGDGRCAIISQRYHMKAYGSNDQTLKTPYLTILCIRMCNIDVD